MSPQREGNPHARARSGLNRRSRRIVVDALPPRAVGQICSLDRRPALVPERHKFPCKPPSRWLREDPARGTGNAMSQIRRRSGSGAPFFSGATDRTDTTYGAHVDLRAGVLRVVIARQETRKYRAAHGIRRLQTNDRA